MLANDLKVLNSMTNNGSTFIKALAEAFYKANKQDFQKLKDAFPEYWEHYKNNN